MNPILTIILSILIFGFLIFIHEFGHYIFARIFNVTITEFSLGMGPKLVSYKSKKTGINYCISAVPLGGYVAMVGEDGDSEDPNALNKKPAWQRLIIIVAGATINIIAGVLATIILISIINIGGTTVAAFPETDYEISSADSVLQVGDETVDITVLRNGEEMTFEVTFPVAEEQGQTFGMMDFQVKRIEKNFFKVIGYSFSKSVLTVRMCWESIIDLITGRYYLAAVSGPVGISEVIGEAANHGGASLLNIVALISINLGVMNLLPIPALDGGRTVLILVEMISGKKLPPNVEATVNGVSLIILLGLSAIILIKDVVGLFI